MHGEDRLAPGAVGKVDHHAPVEAPGAQEGAIEDVGLVGGGEEDDPLAAGEAIHLGEDLVERLLLLARPADRHLPARPPDGVELVDEDDGGRLLARLLEEVAHARRSHADDHLHELRAAEREEGDPRLARHRAREQCLSRARRPDKQDTFRGGAAQPCVLGGIAQEIDDLDQFVLRLVDPGDVGKGDASFGRLVETARGALAQPSGERSAESPLLRRAPEHPDVEPDDQECGGEAEEEVGPGVALLDGLGADLHAVGDEERLEPRIGERRKFGGEVGDLRPAVWRRWNRADR